MSAQIFEAEDAILTGGAEKISDSAVSGEFYVAQKAGNLSLEIELPEEGYYNIFLYASSPGGNKINNFSIDGLNVDFGILQNSEFSLKKVVSSFKLESGTHQIKILIHGDG